MDDHIIEKLLEALVEDYTWEELQDDGFMLLEMSMVLGMSKEEAKALLFGAREIKKLRGEVIPDWKVLFNMH